MQSQRVLVARASLHKGIRQPVPHDVQAGVQQQLVLEDVAQFQTVGVGEKHRRQQRIGYAGVTEKDDDRVRILLPLAGSMIAPVMSSNGSVASKTSQNRTQAEIVRARRNHTSTKNRLGRARRSSFQFFSTHLSVRCDDPRCGVELNVNSLKSSARERKTVMPEL